jgi:COP9 signalosome complex subunit 6
VHLVALLGALTRSIEEARGVGKKFWAIEQNNRSNLKMPNAGSGGEGVGAPWDNYGPPKDLRRRGGHRDGAGFGSFGGGGSGTY